ncbi:DUF6285 domain-containing protein [Candidatus Binatia bacterium]|nr:DUF6285 domain-containing protein [Candidatus Binatia bacterium]
MQDRPTYMELLNAVQQFIENDVVPALEGPKKYHARVAANVLAIVSRELATEETHLRSEWERLGTLLDDDAPPPVGREALRTRLRRRNLALCERIRRGDADAGPWRAAVWEHVRQTVVEKLTVADPRPPSTSPASSPGTPG